MIVDVLAQVETPKLEVPSVFENGAYSKENRTFLIRPMGNLDKHFMSNLH